ncbi:MAG: sensor histidine kinase [Proteobacteria bacterium]|nr:sensor histidine kinase [Pseudomonadota bacterium]
MEEINKRIAQKKADYVRYNFSKVQNDILKTFFDLAQEYSTLEDFYQISVAVLQEFMGVEARLYLANDTPHELEFICDSSHGLQAPGVKAPEHIILCDKMYAIDGAFVVPIISKMMQSAPEPSKAKELLQGMLEVEAPQALTSQEQFFLCKFANRIGFNLYNRRISIQNIKHLKFINTLVMDIEHNVIIPNMYFKHLFNRIRAKIRDVEDLEKKMRDMKNAIRMDRSSCENIITKVSVLHQDLIDYHQEMLRHHNNCSLFLESLFRRDHFEKGHLVLHSKKCFVEKEIILPQLEHFTRRLEGQGITIERPTDMSAEQIPLRVNIGLLSQVYANYFSNAVKYAEVIIDHAGRPRKALAYGRKALPDYFGVGLPGVKFNVFTTGPHLDSEDAAALYTEGFRGKNSVRQAGTGHGLTFVSQVVEMHGGEAGYEATEEGNNFFFILPVDEI